MPRVDTSVLRMAGDQGPNPRCDVEPVSLVLEVKTGPTCGLQYRRRLSREVALRRIAQTMGPNGSKPPTRVLQLPD